MNHFIILNFNTLFKNSLNSSYLDYFFSYEPSVHYNCSSPTSTHTFAQLVTLCRIVSRDLVSSVLLAGMLAPDWRMTIWRVQ